MEREQTIKYFINRGLALSRPPEGPVASYIGPFAEWLGDRDYSLVSMKNQVLMAAGFSKWLGQKAIELSDLSDEHLGRYLLDRAHSRGDINNEEGGASKDVRIFRQVIPLPAR